MEENNKSKIIETSNKELIIWGSIAAVILIGLIGFVLYNNVYKEMVLKKAYNIIYNTEFSNYDGVTYGEALEYWKDSKVTYAYCNAERTQDTYLDYEDYYNNTASEPTMKTIPDGKNIVYICIQSISAIGIDTYYFAVNTSTNEVVCYCEDVCGRGKEYENIQLFGTGYAILCE